MALYSSGNYELIFVHPTVMNVSSLSRPIGNHYSTLPTPGVEHYWSLADIAGRVKWKCHSSGS